MSREEDVLSKVFDYIILGTGCEESIVAASLQKNGKEVLQLDSHDFYGGYDTSLSLKEFLDIHRKAESPDFHFPDSTKDYVAPDDIKALLEDENTKKLKFPERQTLKELKIDACDDLPSELTDKSRRITIDLHPRLTFGRSIATETMVTSGVSSYLEFKLLNGAHVLTKSNKEMVSKQVPAAKKDVFSSGDYSLLEKHKLMGFLMYLNDLKIAADAEKFNEEISDSSRAKGHVHNWNEITLGTARSLLRPQNKATKTYPIAQYEHRPFLEFLEKEVRITGYTANLFLYAIATLPGVHPSHHWPSEEDSIKTYTTAQVLPRLLRYIGSIGIYGPTAYLVPMYGVSELAQAYSRTAALKGSIHMLRARFDSYLIQSSSLESNSSNALEQTTSSMKGVVLSSGLVLRAKNYVIRSDFLPSSLLKCTGSEHLVAGVFILDSPWNWARAQASSNSENATPTDNSKLEELRFGVCCPGELESDFPYTIFALQQGPSNGMTSKLSDDRVSVLTHLYSIVNEESDVPRAYENIQRLASKLWIETPASPRVEASAASEEATGEAETTEPTPTPVPSSSIAPAAPVTATPRVLWRARYSIRYPTFAPSEAAPLPANVTLVHAKVSRASPDTDCLFEGAEALYRDLGGVGPLFTKAEEPGDDNAAEEADGVGGASGDISPEGEVDLTEEAMQGTEGGMVGSKDSKERKDAGVPVQSASSTEAIASELPEAARALQENPDDLQAALSLLNIADLDI